MLIIKNYYWLGFLSLLISTNLKLSAQSLQGKVLDENKEPIAYASIFVKEAKQGTTSNSDGMYLINLPKGKYSITFRCLGFETIEKQIEVKEGKNTYDITLPVKPYQIAPVTIGSKGEDPAYSIIRKAIGMAPYYQNQIKEFNAEVYMKGTLKIKKLSWLVKKAMGNSDDVPKEGQFYLQESVNNIKFTAPDKYDQNVKMIRSNIPGGSGGNDDVMRFLNASFYQPQIGEIILPLAPYALNHYNFKYDSYSIQDNRVINRIKVIPKRKSKQLVSGYIYIADDYWNIHEIDLTNESIIGTIRIKQTFGEIESDVWMPISHHYVVNGKFMGSEGDITYISSVKYSNVKVNTNIKTPVNIAQRQNQQKTEEPKPKTPQKKVSAKQQAKEQKNAEKLEKLMSKEALSNKEMYELAKLIDKQVKQADTSAKTLEVIDPITVTIDSMARKADSTMWQEMRPVILTSDEIKVDEALNKKLQQKTDSTENDSLKQKKQSLFSTITFGKTWRNTDKKQTIRFSGLLSPNEFRFNTVDGFVVGSTFSYRKDFANNSFYIRPSVSYAFARKVPMGNVSSSLTYAGMKRGTVWLNFGYTSMDFNQNVGVSNITNTVASLGFGRNYMKLFENRYISIYNRIDLLNGLELYAGATFSNRKMLDNNTDFILVSRNRGWYTPNIPENHLINTDNYGNNKAFIGTIRLSYTPFYHYRISDNRKRMLYSKYPTFRINGKFGIPGVLESNSNFINLEASISQTINSGPGNRFSYNLIYGDFITKEKLYFNDFAHFNTQITPVTARSFNNSYQNIDYYERSTNSRYGQVMVNYSTPYLALKYLPFLSNRMWEENLHFSSLFTKDFKPYYEVGYSMSQIGALASVGVFAGFEGQKFYSINVKLSLLLIGFDM